MPMRIIQISGTKGKGSTSTYLANIVSAAGYKCGLFVSPHIQREEERISIDGKCIPRKDLDRLLHEAEEPRYFQSFFKACLAWFAENNVEVAVMETGLGGRKDPVTELDVCESILTHSGMDHMDLLGDTIQQIAMEKAMTIRPQGYVITMPQQEAVMRIFESTCALLNARLVKVKEKDILMNADGSFDFQEYTNMRIHAIGRRQYVNAVTAIVAARALYHVGVFIGAEDVRAGLAATYMLARQQYIEAKDILVDGAHNLDSLQFLHETLKESFAGREKVLLVSAMSNKDVSYLGKIAADEHARVIVSEMDYERCMRAEKLAELFTGASVVEVIPNVGEAFAAARRLAKESGAMIVIAGSLYLAGEILDLLKTEENA